MAYSIKLKRSESVIYIILWLVVLLMPIFISYSEVGIDWSRVSREWIRFVPYLLVFLIHNYLLFPQLFVRNKRFWYFLTAIVLILLAGFFGDVIGNLLNVHPTEKLPRIRLGEMPPGDLPPLNRDHGGPRPTQWYKLVVDNALVSILVIGFNAAIKVSIIWQAEEQKHKELEKEKLKTELAFLKNQVSPHFFMNTLNNIHALIDINSEDAKASLIKLSKLMRYLLYDSDEGKTTLAKEIEFVKSYVDLMKLRFTSQVSVKLSFPEKIPNIEMPPMLFTSLLENAFKHGISYQKESFIEIMINANNEFLFFRIKNSKKDSSNRINKSGGIGLENLRKRLDLIYRDCYILEQNQDDNSFEINIKLPLNG